VTRLVNCLWFDGQAEEAANFYAALLPNSSVDRVVTAPGDYPSGKQGDVITVDFTLLGRPFMGLNGGPQFQFTEAISMIVECDTQEEVDLYWESLSSVPEAEQCGWCKDRYGLSWQITPRVMIDLLGDADPGRAKRAFEAMMHMKKLDIAALEAAAAG